MVICDGLDVNNWTWILFSKIFFSFSARYHRAENSLKTSIVKTIQTDWWHHLPVFSYNEPGIGWRGGWGAVGCKLTPLDGYMAVCPVLTMEVYGIAK